MTDYQKYQLQWMIDHGYSLQDLMRELTELQYDDPEASDRISTPISELLNEWELVRGYGSVIWACERVARSGIPAAKGCQYSVGYRPGG